MNRACFGNSAEVIACEVHEHHMLGCFLRVGEQRLLVDQPAASAVDDPRAGLHARQRAGVDQMPRLLAQRHMQGDEIHPRQQVFEGHEIDAQVSGHLLGHIRVVGHHVHLHGLRSPRHLATDAPESDHADGLVLELDAEIRLAIPGSGAQGRGCLGHVSRQRQNQRHGVLRGGHGVAPRKVHHQHAGARRRLDVDVVDADAGTADDPQVGTRGHGLGVHQLRGVHDDPRVRLDHVGQGARLAIDLMVDLAAGLLEDRDAAPLEGAANEDPRRRRAHDEPLVPPVTTPRPGLWRQQGRRLPRRRRRRA